MSNLSDKEIDRLSREAADSYEPNDSSLSWSRLEQKLDLQMPERPPDGFRFGRISPYMWGPAVALIAGASFFFIKNVHYSQHSTQNIQNSEKSISKPDASGKNASGKRLYVDSASAVRKANASGHIESKNITDADRKSFLNAASGADAFDVKKSGAGSNGSVVYQNGTSVHGRNSATDTKSGLTASGSASAAGSTNSETLAADKNESELHGIAMVNESSGNGKTKNKNQIHLPVVVTNGYGLGKVSGNDSLMNQLAQSKTPIHQKSLHLNRSLNIGFTFGPDYTNAGGIPNNQIGNSVGLTLGYYLTDKLSVNTGFIYTNKFYWSKGRNYFFRQPANITPAAYAISFAAPPPIDYINGASNIWELPLTLRYDFAHHNKTRFFANAGLSSYFMMKQTYIYFGHTGQNQLAYKISDNQQVNYWFGIADISAGFEAEIGKGFSFQAEPFLKLPLRNMGVEDLRLTSYGFLMTFKYAPVLGRSKK
jgi:hypothetical protein